MQREIEAAGIATLTLSFLPDLTRSVSAPRVAGIAYPSGMPFGRPGDAEGQRAVLRAALEALAAAREPGTQVLLPFEWPVPARKARTHPAKPPPIVKLIARKPWAFLRFLKRDPPEPAG